jgi:type IV pilus assembly protein PilN
MAKINLLPWRQERRQQKQKQFYVMLGISAAFGLAVAIGGIMYVDQLIDNQNKRNDLLTREIKGLEAKIKEIESLEKERASLLRRKQVIEELQSSRSQMVHLFDELVRTIPDGVRLLSIKQAGQQLTLNGTAQSNARVSSYMRSLQQSGWMTNPDLNIIEAKGGDRSMPYQFTLRVALTKPKTGKEDETKVAMLGGSTP